ncbi:hypothetical protein AXYL_04015 [Achromobacter xylosoxidans A8]|uniref:Uncharacterized protein n=1 Tax=Achromobacter xylosoxidans (strain A8) TaxID=762376 RepID=E3HSL8_ACHXA|nr:hypothetical protein [Achromobacter xylosoxidans]ADP17335.1 hypothetical protein AXYL_04015 [Achromobacter xylosoxidans A8]
MTDIPVLPFRPIQAGYAPALGDGSQRIALEGGSGRYRAGVQSMAHTLQATYVVFGEEYGLLMGFWRKMRRIGGGPFYADLTIDSSLSNRYVAHFIPGSARPVPIGGDGWTVTFQLEVESLPEFDDETLDYWGAILTLFAIYGSLPAIKEMMNLLAKLVNEDLPHAR